MVPDEVRRLYQTDLPLLKIVAERMRETLMSLCNETGYAYATRPNLVKSVESTAAKLESGRFASWQGIDDLVACTVVVPTRTAERNVLHFLRENFDEHETRSRDTVELDPTVFRFGATRFIGSLRSIVPSNQHLRSFRFEVQIRTAFEHAWSVATHELAYKSDRVDWRVERLAAQLKASVEQLDMLVNAYETNADLLDSQPYPSLDSQRHILEHFRRHGAEGRIPQECIPVQWSSFAKNVYSLLWRNRGRGHPRAFGKLVQQLLDACDIELSQRPLSRTVSLFQFVLGVVLEKRIIEPVLAERYFAVVTPSLESCFPATVEIPRRSRCLLEQGGVGPPTE